MNCKIMDNIHLDFTQKKMTTVTVELICKLACGVMLFVLWKWLPCGCDICMHDNF